MRSPEQRVQGAQEALWRRFPLLRPPPPPRPPPEEGRLILGRDKDGAPFPLSSRLLAAHIDMVGGTGSGKSATMRHLAWSHMETHPKFNRATILIDPHGAHGDSLLRATLRRIVETRLYERKRVYVIDANSAWCAGLRLLDGSADASVTADHMIEAFERLQNDQSLMETPTLRRALHGLLAVLAELKWSLAEADLLLDPADRFGVRESALARISDRYASKALLRLQYLSQDARLYKEFQIETIGTENRLAPILSSAAMRAVVGTQTIDMRDVLDEGAVLLVNTAGGDTASEIAGDLLGKLVMRALLFAAKRRRTNSLALILADECARYVSQDWERALAEFRKFSCCLCSAHQTFAMLGKPDDPVRQAIEKIPATKIALRMNSMQEATAWAPELVRLNLELAVDTLRKPVVIGHNRIWLSNESQGISGGVQTNMSRGVTNTDSTEVGESAASTKGRNYTKTYSSAVTHSESETDGENWSDTETVGSNWSETDTEGENYSQTAAESEGAAATRSESRGASVSDSTSDSRGGTASRNGSTGNSNSNGVSAASSRSYDRENLEKLNGERPGTPEPSGGTETTGTNANSGTNSARGWSEGANWSQGRAHSEDNAHSTSSAVTHQTNTSRAETRGISRSHATTVGGSYSHATTRGGSHSRTVGLAETEGEADAYGTSEAETLGTSRSTGSAHSVNTSSGLGFSLGISHTTGRAEGLEPILKDLPGAVHGLENVRHMAAEMLCTLPDGVAVVRTVRGGRIEGAVVRVPYRACAPVSDEQYAADLDRVMQHGRFGKPMSVAMREIDERERRIAREAGALRPPPPEPESFRIPLRKPSVAARASGSKQEDEAQPVKGGRTAVAEGERAP